MGFVSDRDDARGLAGSPLLPRSAHLRRMSMMPGTLDRDAACVAVVRPGDPAALRMPTARMLTRDEPQIRHQLWRPTKASEVVELGHPRHGHHRIHAMEATKPRDRRRVGLLRGPVRECEFDHAYALRRLIECDAVGLENGLIVRMLESQASKPLPARHRPVLLPPAKATWKKRLPETVPGSNLIFLCVFAGSADVPNGLVLRTRRTKFRQETAFE